MQLPDKHDLPVRHLAGVFRRVTNSYKFFWLLALLKNLDDARSRRIHIDQLLADMVAHVWYPITYYRLSFGKQDKLARTVRILRAETDLTRDASYQRVRRTAMRVLKRDGEIASTIRDLEKYVPYRFLTPWFSRELRGLKDYKKNRYIVELAEDHFTSRQRPPLYRFAEQAGALELHPQWRAYLTRHRRLVRDFCLWNLVLFLQGRNPNVPNLADKLFPPETRNLSSAKRFWRLVFARESGLRCIYSGRRLSSESYDVDHFLPWSFVSHDQIWNLAPVASDANASKSDRLPDLSVYFDSFAALQHSALEVALGEQKRRQLDQYAVLFSDDTPDLRALSRSEFTSHLRDQVAPLIQIASNMGYRRDWRYEP